jgi:hypothetical protein
LAANLTPQYHEAEARFRKAVSSRDKLAALTEMLREVPKHKGTEKLQADLKRRIARLRNEESHAGGAGRRANPFLVRPEGGGQVLLLGAPNSGKSSLLAALTNARPEVADYPFTTRTPHPGMLFHEDVRFQLVDLPPVTAGYFEPWIADLARAADLALLLADLQSPGLLEGVEAVLEKLAEHHVHLSSAASEEGLGASDVALRTILLASRADGGAEAGVSLVEELYGGRFEIHPVSVLRPETLRPLGAMLFRALSLVRVYTKMPGKEPDLRDPFVLPVESTILDVAAAVHKDFVEHLKFARVWGSAQFEGQRVQRDYVVQDRDVVELHL